MYGRPRQVIPHCLGKGAGAPQGLLLRLHRLLEVVGLQQSAAIRLGAEDRVEDRAEECPEMVQVKDRVEDKVEMVEVGASGSSVRLEDGWEGRHES